MNLKRELKFLCKLLLYPLYWVGRITPRCGHKWLFGTGWNHFLDNSKYLFLRVAKEHSDIRAIWIANSREELHEVRSTGLECHLWYSPAGLYHSFTAGVFLSTNLKSDINRYAGEGAFWVYLGHGIGLKRMRWIRQESINIKTFGYNFSESVMKLRPRIEYYPMLWQIPDLCLSTSRSQALEFHAPMFRIPLKRCVLADYPRNWILLCTEEDRIAFIARYEPPEAMAFIDRLQEFSKVYIYMPTWRSNGYDFIGRSGIDFDRMEETLSRTNSCLVLRMHPLTCVDLPDSVRCPHIIPFEPRCHDINTILPYTDCLITDYSSVYTDFVLMDKEIIVFPFDKKEFLKNSYDLPGYDEYYLGHRVMTFEELLVLVRNRTDCHLSREERDFLMEEFWGARDSGVNIVEEIRKRYRNSEWKSVSQLEKTKS